ncbi:MAG: hypothetical protein K5682_08950, partial [Lachnospiraceae bacterium]|nr:hypothetical protein [Lachnospiraceae bacterium]
NTGGSLNQGEETIRPAVRKYYTDTMKWAIISIVIGLLFVVIGFPKGHHYYNPALLLAVLLGIALVALGIYLIIRKSGGEAEAINAANFERERLKKRALVKLGLDESQVSLIEPVILNGFGISPNARLGDTATANALSGMAGISARRMKKLVKNSYDPFVAYKLGSNDQLHSMLIQTTLFFFTENQVLIYSGNVDTSTGKVYHETTREIFYKDITKVTTSQDITKYYSKQRRDFVYKIEEFFSVSVYGEQVRFSVNTDLDASVIDAQIAGMKALLRDKKVQ